MSHYRGKYQGFCLSITSLGSGVAGIEKPSTYMMIAGDAWQRIRHRKPLSRVALLRRRKGFDDPTVGDGVPATGIY